MAEYRRVERLPTFSRTGSTAPLACGVCRRHWTTITRARGANAVWCFKRLRVLLEISSELVARSSVVIASGSPCPHLPWGQTLGVRLRIGRPWSRSCYRFFAFSPVTRLNVHRTNPVVSCIC